MGAVDLVVQIESPPSVASALQRVGRAGHQVGEVSRGVLFPKHRGDLAQTAVAVERMRTGAIESLRVPGQPARRARPAGRRRDRPRRRGPSTTSSSWCRRARRSPSCRAAPTTPPSTCSAAATPPTSSPSSARASCGTGSPARSPAAPAPSGSRSPAAAPSPTAACSASSWSAARGPAGGSASSTRRWSTSRGSATSSRSAPPAGASRTSPTTGCWSPRRPGVPGRLPFWKGDALGPPGRARRRDRRVHPRARRAARGQARRRGPAADGLDEWAAGNLVAYLHEQREATNRAAQRPDPASSSGSATSSATGGSSCTRPTAPRCTPRGRWRSTPGCASATASTARRCASDDGIVVRIPDTDAEPPGGDVDRLRARRDRGARHRRGRRLGAVRRPVPRVRGPRPAAPPPRPRPPLAAVAAAPALGRAARGRRRSTRPSRSCSRPCASASRTSTTCPRWSR